MDRFENLDGKFLIAMPNMGDPRFERAVIFLCAHSSEGAMGFVVNRGMESPTVPGFLTQLNILAEGELAKLSPGVAKLSMRAGGPVEPGRGFVLHSPDFKAKTTLEIRTGICLTATLEILRAIATGRGPAKFVLLLGYSGWASGQLEEEIAANGWLTSSADESIVFDGRDETKYRRALRAMGVDPQALSSQAGHA